MSHSTHVGFNAPPATAFNGSELRENWLGPALFDASWTVGVGHDPDAVPAVRSANGGSGNTVPFRVIPDLSERPEHAVQSARAKGRDVLGNDPPRPDFRDDPVHLEPEAGA
jgi:hypothetical protein